MRLHPETGSFYATTTIARLGHANGGLVRAGCACYTTADHAKSIGTCSSVLPPSS